MNDGTLVFARHYALLHHGDQRYAAFPYEYHLRSVVRTLAYAGVSDCEMLSAAWLHDVVEDTSVTIRDIYDQFGARVARLVSAVTDDEGATRAARKRHMVEKLTNAGADAVLLKQADRLCNFREAVKNRNRNLIESYTREHFQFFDRPEIRQLGNTELMFALDKLARKWWDKLSPATSGR